MHSLVAAGEISASTIAMLRARPLWTRRGGAGYTTRGVATAKRKKTKRREVVEADVRAATADEAEAPSPVSVASSTRFQTALIVVAAIYIVTVWLDGVGSNLPARWTPRVWLYFSQVAALFKNAGVMAIDYRAEGWSCSEKRWVEVDVRPFFQLDAENKESRFHRVMQFYRKERKVMRALESYVMQRNNAVSSRPQIVGVRFLSLRIPYPKLGTHVEPVEHKPLASYPNEMRHNWYWTPASQRRDRCGDHTPVPAKDEADDDRTAPSSNDSRSEAKEPE
jgi:hypothetical protein